jgi:N-acetylglucosamine-6-phosphate deacetylase
MRSVTYINGKVLQGCEFQSGLAVVVSGTKIVKVIPDNLSENDNTETVDLDGNYLAPGFIDTQVNGGGGVLFNDSPSIEGIRTIAKAHRQFGTTGLLPTLISDDISVIQKGVNAVNSAIQEGVPGVLGIHIEGPFLNLDRRGIHNPDKIKRLTHSIIRELEPVRNGCSLLTIAPETVEPGMIRQLVEKGFVISAGHSNANYGEIKVAIEHGLRGFTHLFNAMSQLGVREPGVVGAALDHGETWCGVIADGHHVSPVSLKIAHRCKGTEKLMLVTDAMPPVGWDKNEFYLLGNRITVKDGVCVDASGTLAGAALDMMSAVRNMMAAINCGLAQACLMASANPAAFLGLQHKFGSIKAGMQADFVIIDEQFNLLETITDDSQPLP